MESKKVLAIDVGIKNLSFCYLSTTTTKTTVLEWDNICVTEDNCRKIKIENLTEEVLRTLLDKFNDGYDIDVVLIENQPMLKNGMMKTVAVVLYTYFNMMKIMFGNVREVRFISATNKLKCKDIDGISIETYRDRKQASIALAKVRVQRLCPDKSSWFENHQKKDDLADSLNQAIYYILNVFKHVLSE